MCTSRLSSRGIGSSSAHAAISSRDRANADPSLSTRWLTYGALAPDGCSRRDVWSGGAYALWRLPRNGQALCSSSDRASAYSSCIGNSRGRTGTRPGPLAVPPAVQVFTGTMCAVDCDMLRAELTAKGAVRVQGFCARLR